MLAAPLLRVTRKPSEIPRGLGEVDVRRLKEYGKPRTTEARMGTKQVEELILTSLEHALGGVKVYTTALRCIVNPEVKEDFERHVEEGRSRVRALREACASLDIDAARETSGRAVLQHNSGALVAAMEIALRTGEPETAELVACACVVLAGARDHFDRDLYGKCAEHLEGTAVSILEAAYDAIEDHRDEHFYRHGRLASSRARESTRAC